MTQDNTGRKSTIIEHDNQYVNLANACTISKSVGRKFLIWGPVMTVVDFGGTTIFFEGDRVQEFKNIIEGGQ